MARDLKESGSAGSTKRMKKMVYDLGDGDTRTVKTKTKKSGKKVTKTTDKYSDGSVKKVKETKKPVENKVGKDVKIVKKTNYKSTTSDGNKRRYKRKTTSDKAGVLKSKIAKKSSKGFKEKEKTKVKVKDNKTVGVKSKETMTGRKMGYKGKDTFKKESSTTDKYGNVVGGKYTKRKLKMKKKK